MSLLGGCISSAEVDPAVDFRALEDDEHQIRSIFSSAIHLKNEVRTLTSKLAEYEVTTQKLHRMIRERETTILQLEMNRDEEYHTQLKSFKQREAESTRARADMKRQMNNAVNETMLANNVIQGMASRIKTLEEQLHELHHSQHATVEKACQISDEGAEHEHHKEQLYALRASTTKLISAVRKLSRKGAAAQYSLV